MIPTRNMEMENIYYSSMVLLNNMISGSLGVTLDSATQRSHRVEDGDTSVSKKSHA